MRVLLISASNYQEPYPVYPIGLDYVAAAISPPHEVHRADAVEHPDLDALAVRVREVAPDVVGISLRNVDNTAAIGCESFVDHYRDVVRKVREATSAPVILGGSGFSLFGDRLVEMVGADYGVIGEGERMSDLLAALENNEAVHDLPGVVAAGAPASMPRPYLEPLHRTWPSDHGGARHYLETGGVLGLQSKRGCPFSCIYCTYPYIEGHTTRFHGAENVARDAVRLEQAGAGFLFFTDSVFNTHEKYAVEVAEAMRDAGVTVPWGGFFAPRVKTPDFFFRLAACGLTHVEFGTESLSAPMLEAYNKPYTVEEAVEAHEQAVAAGLFVCHYILLCGPGETGETVAETLETVERLDRSAFVFYCGIRIFPGTEIRRIAIEEGSLDPCCDLVDPVFYTSPDMSPERAAGLVEAAAQGRANWITPGRAARVSRITKKLYSLGHKGLLWERLIR
ncbi:MAG: lipid biosynthesis B12-binding/radical SAM protein [Desulfatibacillaceae bacterium]